MAGMYTTICLSFDDGMNHHSAHSITSTTTWTPSLGPRLGERSVYFTHFLRRLSTQSTSTPKCWNLELGLIMQRRAPGPHREVPLTDEPRSTSWASTSHTARPKAQLSQFLGFVHDTPARLACWELQRPTPTPFMQSFTQCRRGPIADW